MHAIALHKETGSILLMVEFLPFENCGYCFGWFFIDKKSKQTSLSNVEFKFKKNY